MFAFHFALSEPPKYPLAGGGTIASCEASIMQRAESIFQLNADQARGELNIDDYPLQIVHPSVFDPSRVPPGFGSVKIEYHFVAHEHADGSLTYYEVHRPFLDIGHLRWLDLTRIRVIRLFPSGHQP
jgi:hypothetical protein